MLSHPSERCDTLPLPHQRPDEGLSGSLGRKPSPGPQEWGKGFLGLSHALAQGLPASPQLSSVGVVCEYSPEFRELPAGDCQTRPPPELWAVSLPPCPPISVTSGGAKHLPAPPFSPVEAGVPGPQGKAGPEVHSELHWLGCTGLGWNAIFPNPPGAAAASPEGGRLGLCLRGVISTKLSTAWVTRPWGHGEALTSRPPCAVVPA